MPDTPYDLNAAIMDQAEARLRADVQTYAGYLTPQALDSLRASFPGLPPRVNRYEIASLQPQGSEYVCEVRYFARDDSFVVRSRWRQGPEGWMISHAERLWAEGDKRPGFLSRLGGSVLRLFARRRP